jgi:hypothetical protein
MKSRAESRTILDVSNDNLDTPNHDLDTWTTAISDAEEMIQEAKSKISRLRKSIKTFKRLRDSGEPFPAPKEEAKNDAA